MENNTLPIASQDAPGVKASGKGGKGGKAARRLEKQKLYNLSDAEVRAFGATHLDMELPLRSRLWDKTNIAVFREQYVGKREYGWTTNSDGALEWDRELYRRKGLTKEEEAARITLEHGEASMKGDDEVATTCATGRKSRLKGAKTARQKSRAEAKERKRLRIDTKMTEPSRRVIDNYRPGYDTYRPGSFNCRRAGRRGRAPGDEYRPQSHPEKDPRGQPTAEEVAIRPDYTHLPALTQEKKSLGREVMEFVGKCTGMQATEIGTETFLNELCAKIVPLEAKDEFSAIKKWETERQRWGGLISREYKELQRLRATSIYDLRPKQHGRLTHLESQVAAYAAANPENRPVSEEMMTQIVREILQKDPKHHESRDRRFLDEYDFLYLYANPVWAALVGTLGRSKRMAGRQGGNITVDIATTEVTEMELERDDTRNENLTVAEALDRELELYDVQMG
ncbi:hypothetical protein HYFRA_00000011 [Hymenoscyphus fraxineus]|uniref:Uncharacterized protein n=1 Tax=Hymenoscyphus fraxineus TaxID=746836 RepID=A0A9N9L322_9HELO|nr:hypothetical protein HYFRA_00000011 [Hymenoscyphus fraxineus]